MDEDHKKNELRLALANIKNCTEELRAGIITASDMNDLFDFLWDIEDAIEQFERALDEQK